MNTLLPPQIGITVCDTAIILSLVFARLPLTEDCHLVGSSGVEEQIYITLMTRLIGSIVWLYNDYTAK